MGVEAFRCKAGAASQPTAGALPQQPAAGSLPGIQPAGDARSNSHLPSSQSNGVTVKSTQAKDADSTFATPAHALQQPAATTASAMKDAPTTSHYGSDMLSGRAGDELVASTSSAESHCGAVLSLALCGDYVCSSGSDAMIKVWKAGSLEFVRSELH